jgi:hypothetical protein
MKRNEQERRKQKKNVRKSDNAEDIGIREEDYSIAVVILVIAVGEDFLTLFIVLLHWILALLFIFNLRIFPHQFLLEAALSTNLINSPPETRDWCLVY